MILSNGKEIIKIKPKDILKINGKEAYYNGLDISSRKANFIFNDDNQSKSYSFVEIKKIHLSYQWQNLAKGFLLGFQTILLYT